MKPCAEDPEAWFISKDGKQYPADEFLTEAERTSISRSVLAKSDETPEQHEARVSRALSAVESDRKRQALVRRRHAREACYDCPFRLPCLDMAMDPSGPATHGTWGGYYEEELKALRLGIRQRRKRNTDT